MFKRKNKIEAKIISYRDITTGSPTAHNILHGHYAFFPSGQSILLASYNKENAIYLPKDGKLIRVWSDRNL